MRTLFRFPITVIIQKLDFGLKPSLFALNKSPQWPLERLSRSRVIYSYGPGWYICWDAVKAFVYWIEWAPSNSYSPSAFRVDGSNMDTFDDKQVWWALFARSCRYLNKAVHRHMLERLIRIGTPPKNTLEAHSITMVGIQLLMVGFVRYTGSLVSFFHIARQSIKIRCREIKRRLAKAVGTQRINFHSAGECERKGKRSDNEWP